jgi:ferredoxin
MPSGLFMQKHITRVWLDESKEDCTMCSLCETTCPEVFRVPEKMTVLENADLRCQDKIETAAHACPVSVIAIEYDYSKKRDNVE